MTAAAQPPQDPGAEIANTVARWLEQAREQGGLIPDVKIEARCRVCRDSHIRKLVNAMFSRGFTPASVHDTLEFHNRTLPPNKRITYDIVCRHRREHYNLQDPANAIYRKMAEAHYLAEGFDIETGTGSIVTLRSFLETIMAKSYETLVDTEVVSLEEGLKAASRLSEISRKDDGLLERAQMLADLNKAITLMRKYVPVEAWPALQAELRGEPVPQVAIAEPEVRIVDIDDSDDEEDEH